MCISVCLLVHMWYVYQCVPACPYVHHIYMCTLSLKCHQRASGPLELKLQMIVKHYAWDGDGDETLVLWKKTLLRKISR